MFIINLSLSLIYKSNFIIDMYIGENPGTCKIWYYLWLQASTGGLGRISHMDEGRPLSMFVEVVTPGDWWGAASPSTPQQENAGLREKLASKARANLLVFVSDVINAAHDENYSVASQLGRQLCHRPCALSWGVLGGGSVPLAPQIIC